jgi:hypothetical protein
LHFDRVCDMLLIAGLYREKGGLNAEK